MLVHLFEMIKYQSKEANQNTRVLQDQQILQGPINIAYIRKTNKYCPYNAVTHYCHPDVHPTVFTFGRPVVVQRLAIDGVYVLVGVFAKFLLHLCRNSLTVI